jgi:putative effector of murein hydrolase LrgA (UPF0299 family)
VDGERVRALREDPRLIRYMVMLFVGVPVVLGLSAFFPDRLDDQLVPFLIAFTITFFVVYALALLIEAWFRRRWSSGDRG